jgi:4-amino-4-deoxy-L-arabinose transferase-like glycosyltransferase
MSDARLTPRPIFWPVLLVPAVVQFVLHVLTNGSYGIFRDEYYYLACAERLAWGYVDQPPLSIWILAGWTAVFGDSVHSIRILPAVCGAVLVVLTGMIAARLGGGRWAQAIAAVGSAIGAAGLVIAGFYSMNCFDLVLWAAAFYLLVVIAGTGDGRWWPWFGLVVGIGLFNKIGLIVLGMGLVFGLLLTKHRRHLADWRLYAGGAIALAFLAPYALWNAATGWPTREFIANAKQFKITAAAPLEFLSENILQANPATLVLWLPGLIWLLVARRARSHRMIGLVCVAIWVLLVVQKSKPYYFASVIPVMLAAGAAAIEGWTEGGRWRWARWVMAANLAVGLAIFVPMGLPVLTPAALAEYQATLGIAPRPAEVGHVSTLPQYFSDRFGWQELARTVGEVYGEIDPETRSRTVIIGSNYGHAGAMEYWSETYGLPPVYSSHNNYWLWGPPTDPDIEVVIATGVSRERLLQYFSEVEEVAHSKHQWALESNISVSVCRRPKVSFAEIWPGAKNFL